MPESLLEELGYGLPKPEVPIKEKPQSLLGELGYQKSIQQPTEKPSKLQIAKTVAVAALIPPWTQWAMRQAQRPQRAMIGVLKSLQEPVVPKSEDESLVKQNIRGVVKTAKAFWGGLTFKEEVSGREIVKNMGIPIDDPKFVLKNPGKHLAAEVMGAMYETFTDPFVWWFVLRGNVAAYRQIAARDIAKYEMSILKGTKDFAKFQKELALFRIEARVDAGVDKWGRHTPSTMKLFSGGKEIKSGQLYKVLTRNARILMGKKGSPLYASSYRQLRQGVRNIQELTNRIKTYAQTTAKATGFGPTIKEVAKRIPEVTKAPVVSDAGGVIVKPTGPWTVMSDYAIKDRLWVTTANYLEVGDIVEIPTTKGKSLIMKINDLPKAKKLVGKLLDKGREVTMEARKYPDVPEEEQTLEQLRGQKKDITQKKNMVREELDDPDITMEKKRTNLALMGDLKEKLKAIDKDIVKLEAAKPTEVPIKKEVIREKKPTTIANINEMYKKAMDIADKEGDKGLVKKLQKELQFIGGSITQPSEMRRLRALAHAWRSRKGLTGKAFREIVKNVTGHIHTTHKAVTEGQLKEIIGKIKDIRPKRIGYKTVITEKTEGRINTLKENMTTREEMTDEDFTRILESENIKTPTYFDKAHFATEDDGRKLLKRMLNEAPIIKNRTLTEKALNKNPHIKRQVGAIDKYLKPTQTKVQSGEIKIKIPSLLDMRYYTQNMEAGSGVPFGEVWNNLNEKRLNLNKKINDLVDKVENAGGDMFNKIAADKKAVQRINDFVASKLPAYVAGKPSPPPNITAQEKNIATTMAEVLKDFETSVRYNRFYDWYDYGTRVPNAPEEELERATEILETEGDEALKKWLAGRSWGIIRSGYDIGEVVKPKISIQRFKPTAMSKAHTQSRQSVVFQKYDRDILKRFAKYVRQMTYLTELRPEMSSFMTLFESNSDLFKDPLRVASSLSKNLREMKGQKDIPGALVDWVTMLYSQSMRAVFLDPRKYLRNLHQNLAFYASPEDIAKFINTPLNRGELEFFATQVTQLKGIKRDYLFEDFPGIPGLKNFNKFIDKINKYPWTDEVNRMLCFRIKIGKIKAVMRKYPDDIKKMMAGAGFGDLEPLQRKYALLKLAKEGKDAMARYVAKEVTNNVHFLYERSQRSPSEQGGDAERILSNILTFRKGYVQRIVKEANKLKPGRKGVEAPYGARRRAFRSIIGMTVTSLMVGWFYMKLTGSRRNPYSPKEITSDISLGGLAVGTQEEVGNLVRNVLNAATGDRQALKQVVSDITTAANLLIPIYRIAIDSLDSIAGYKTIDRAIIRQIHSALDKRYKAQPMGYYKIERTAVEKFQHAVFGTRPAEARIKEEKAKKKKEEEEMTPSEKEEAKRRQAYEEYKKGR